MSTKPCQKSAGRRWVKLAQIAAAIAFIWAGIWIGHYLPASSPAADLAKLALLFAFMMLLIRAGVEVGVVLVIAGGCLLLFFEASFGAFAGAFTLGLVAGQDSLAQSPALGALVLAICIFSINLMGELLYLSGGIRRLIGATESLLGDVRRVLALLPSIIGLLPMPGGAMLSAPIVKDLANRVELDSEMKTLANYWFRHIWEYCWPLFPAIIVASQLLGGYPMWRICLVQLPISAVAIVVGGLFILRRIPPPSEPARKSGKPAQDLAQAIAVLWPILAVATVVLVISPFLPSGFQKYVMPVGLVVVALSQMAALRLAGDRRARLLRQVFSPRTILLVYGIYLLRVAFELSGGIERVPASLAAYHIPAVLVAAVVPFLVGLLTGYSLAAISVSLPLMLGFVMLGETVRPQWLMLIYCSGFLGVLVSPVHLCLVLTREYFSADLNLIYRVLIPAVLTLAVAVGLYWLLLEWLL